MGGAPRLGIPKPKAADSSKESKRKNFVRGPEETTEDQPQNTDEDEEIARPTKRLRSFPPPGQKPSGLKAANQAEKAYPWSKKKETRKKADDWGEEAGWEDNSWRNKETEWDD